MKQRIDFAIVTGQSTQLDIWVVDPLTGILVDLQNATATFSMTPINTLATAVSNTEADDDITIGEDNHCYIDIPAEDIEQLPALSSFICQVLDDQGGLIVDVEGIIVKYDPADINHRRVEVLSPGIVSIELDKAEE